MLIVIKNESSDFKSLIIKNKIIILSRFTVDEKEGNDEAVILNLKKYEIRSMNYK